MDNVLEYYNVNREYCQKHQRYTLGVFQKIQFYRDRSFMRVGNEERVVIPAGTVGFVTAKYTLLFGDVEVYKTDDITVYDRELNLNGLHSYIFKVLEENNVFDKDGNAEKLNVSFWIRKALKDLHVD